MNYRPRDALQKVWGFEPIQSHSDQRDRSPKSVKDLLIFV